MKTVMIRDLDDRLHIAAKVLAAQQGKSFNRLLKDAVAEYCAAHGEKEKASAGRIVQPGSD